ncbi:MAG: PhnD/SsuA/transferrin family substrate-binding protein [Pseudomonadota bacterium]
MRPPGGAVATLPMYDWPETKDATDKLWSYLRDSLRASGLPAPDSLDRSRAPDDLWRDPMLLLGQTCGLPLINGLNDFVSVVGTPAYDIDCGAGCYYSAIVVRSDTDLYDVADLAATCLAFNARQSQSGMAALTYQLRGLPSQPEFFTRKIESGSHRRSIQLVASGEADVACIDAVSWQLALRHEPAAKSLRVLAETEPTPGLPFICATRDDWSVDRIHLAVVEAMAAVDQETCDRLLLAGFAQTGLSNYQIIGERLRQTADLVP